MPDKDVKRGTLRNRFVWYPDLVPLYSDSLMVFCMSIPVNMLIIIKPIFHQKFVCLWD